MIAAMLTCRRRSGYGQHSRASWRKRQTGRAAQPQLLRLPPSARTSNRKTAEEGAGAQRARAKLVLELGRSGLRRVGVGDMRHRLEQHGAKGRQGDKPLKNKLKMKEMGERAGRRLVRAGTFWVDVLSGGSARCTRVRAGCMACTWHMAWHMRMLTSRAMLAACTWASSLGAAAAGQLKVWVCEQGTRIRLAGSLCCQLVLALPGGCAPRLAARRRRFPVACLRIRLVRSRRTVACRVHGRRHASRAAVVCRALARRNSGRMGRWLHGCRLAAEEGAARAVQF